VKIVKSGNLGKLKSLAQQVKNFPRLDGRSRRSIIGTDLGKKNTNLSSSSKDSSCKARNSFAKDANDGCLPEAGLTVDVAGNLFGTTFYGGLYNDGTVFELIPRTNGTWMEKVVHNFDWSLYVKDGTLPGAGLVFDAAGNMYGTTENGGALNSGTVFEIMP
jgi:uncharacterized repeat protein (TIGR03803 family)